MEAPRAPLPLLSGRGCGSLQGGGRHRASPAAPTGSQTAHLAASKTQPACFIFFSFFSNVTDVLSNRRCFVAVVLLMFSLRLNLSHKHFLSVGVAPPLGPSNGTTTTTTPATQRIPGLVRKHPSGVVSLHPFVFVHRCVLARCGEGAAFFLPKESDLAADR